jgi:large subunit ribosomal protein L10
MIKEEKVNQIEELAKEAAESGAVVFSDYSGLTVTEMSELRKKLAELGADLRVVKNTLLGLALKKADLGDKKLEGPTAALFSRSADPIESIKTLTMFLKEKGKGALKFGFFEKALVELDRLVELAAILPKPVLQARLVSQLKSPIFKLAYVLSAQQQKLVTVLSQISKTKGGVVNG